jgi:hypothetical protein
MNEFSLDNAILFEVLCLVVRRPKLVPNVKAGYFPKHYVAIAKAALDIHKEFPQEKITRASLRTRLKRELNPKTLANGWGRYKRITKEIFQYQFRTPQQSAEAAEQFARVQQFRKALVGAEQDVNNGHFDTAIKRFDTLRETFAGPHARVFHTFDDFENAPPLSFAIDGFLQNDALTLIGGLSGHGKTFMMLSMVKALLTGEPLWGYFKVPAKVERVLYLIPESSIGPFKYRLKRMRIYKQVEKKRLRVHTLSAGPQPKLDDPQILAEAKGAHIFLDTAIRFGEGEENVASDNQKGLARDVFTLLCAGAKSITGAHHSPKSFSKEWVMTLENILRGTGDIGAMCATVWGVKQINEHRNTLYIQNVKPRDFEPCKPFQIQGRPWIDQEGDFRVLKKPGTCPLLFDEKPSSGAPLEMREKKMGNIERVREWGVNLPSKEIVKKFETLGIDVTESTVRAYKMQIRKEQ